MGATSNQPLRYAAIEFSVKNELLIATSTKNSAQSPQDINQITNQLKTSINGSHELEKDVLHTLAELSKNNEANVLEIEAHIDGQFSIIIDDDQVTATFSYHPAFMGQEIEYDEIIAELEQLGLSEQQVDSEIIKQTLHDDMASSVVIASGSKAVDGTDAIIEVIFSTDSTHGPETKADGTVDHYRTHTYVTVAENTPLLRRIPATQGKSGVTIFGDVIEPIAGEDIQFELNDSIQLDNNDPNILLSLKSGHPIVRDNTVIIDDTLVLEEASLETGNIEFQGSVKITGDVKPNVRVEASGDIHVEGLVENAELIAGNTVYVLSGVISNTISENETHQLDEYTTLIEAEKDIHLKYCTSVEAHAGGSIYIENYSLHSALKAHKEIVAGVNNGKGILIGGQAKANYRVEANIIGSEAYVKSTVHCAGLERAKQHYEKVKRKRRRTEDEHSMLSNVLEQIKSMGTPKSIGNVKLEKAKKIYRQIKVLTQDIDELNEELLTLESEMANIADVIQVNKIIYPNIDIIISGARTKTTTTRKMCIIKNSNNEIEFS